MKHKLLTFTLSTFALFSSCHAQGKNKIQNDKMRFAETPTILESNYSPAEGSRDFNKSEYVKTPETKTTVSVNLTKGTITSSNENAVSVSYKDDIYTIKGNEGAGNFLVNLSGKSDNAAISIDSDKNLTL